MVIKIEDMVNNSKLHLRASLRTISSNHQMISLALEEAALTTQVATRHLARRSNNNMEVVTAINHHMISMMITHPNNNPMVKVERNSNSTALVTQYLVRELSLEATVALPLISHLLNYMPRQVVKAAFSSSENESEG